MPSSDPVIRQLVARIGGLTRAARCANPAESTAAARKASWDRFERQADPDGTMAPDERVRRADLLRREFYTRMALRSAVVRRGRRKAPAGDAA